MISTEAEAVWGVRLIGYDRFPCQLIRWELLPGYTAGRYLDRPLGFAVYSGRWRLDKGTQVTDIADVFSRGAGDLEPDRPRSLSWDPKRFTY